MSRCLVSGSNGLVGRHLCNHLLGLGHEIIAVDNLSNSDAIPEWSHDKRIMSYEIDITKPWEPSSIKSLAPFSVVYHLACEPYEGLSQFTPCSVARSIVIGTINVLRGSINAGFVTRFVNFSSMARYGSGELFVDENETVCDGDTCWSQAPRNGPPFVENKHRTHPEDIYAISKVAAEQSVEMLCKLHDIEYVHLVPHNVFGPSNITSLSDPYRNVIGIWINQLLRGKELTIFGTGEQRRAFSYVADCVPAMSCAGFKEGLNCEVINIGAEKSITINEACEITRKVFVEVTGRKDPGTRYEPSRPCEVANAFCSVEKSVKLLGYADKTPLDEGVRQTIEWAMEVAPNGVAPRYLDKFEIEAKAPKAWLDRQM